MSPRPGRPPGPATEVLYARLPPDLIAYVREQADATGLSMARATGVLLAICRDGGVRLQLAQGPVGGPLARDATG